MILLLAVARAEEVPARDAEAVGVVSLSTMGSTPEGGTEGSADLGEVPAFYAEHATTSPAASLLSGDAAEIQRPGTPGDLVVALGEGFTDRSVSVEVAPVWLAGAPSLSLTEHLSGGLPTLWRNASVSLAVAEGAADDAGEAPIELAGGGRLTFWPAPASGTPQAVFLDALQTGQPPEDAPEASACLALLDDLAGLAEDYSARRETLLTESDLITRQVERQVRLRLLRQEREAIKAEPTEGSRERLAEIRAREAELEDDIAALSEQLAEEADALWDTVVAEWEASSADDRATCAALIQARQGLSIDVAGGVSVRSADSSAAGLLLSGFTGWVAPGWVFDGQKTSLVGMVRGNGADLLDDPSLTLDLGARLIHAWQRYAVSGEGGYRVPIRSAEPGFWSAATLDIRVQEGVWLNGTLGVSSPLDAPASLLSALSLTIDFSEERTVLPSASPPIPDIQ